MSAASPIYDPARLAAVRATGLLDTPAEEAFDRLAGLAKLLLDAPFAFVTVVDETRSFWKSCVGVDATDLADRQNKVEESFCQYVVGSGEPLIIGDVTADPRTSDNPSIDAMGVRAWAGYPLLSPDGQVLGTFCVVDTVVRTWQPRDAQVLETLAAAAAGEIALRDAVATATSLSSAANRSQERLAFLADVGEVLAVSSDPEETVGALAQRMVPLLGDWCMISVLDERTGGARDIGLAHRDQDKLPDVEEYAALHLVSDGAPTVTAIRTGERVVMELNAELIDTVVPNPAARTALARLAPRFAAVFPLQGRGLPFGAISLLNGTDRGRHTEGEISIAQETARRAGLALDNARLHGWQQRIAGVLQRSLLTALPEIAGLEIAARYRPATENAQVGGDWYDAFQLADGSTMLVIGDVVGHDLQAVAVMGQLRTMVRSISYDRGSTPADVLSRVDEAIGGLGVDTLCTALIMQVHPASEAGYLDLTWSSAGHPSPVIVTAAGESVELDDEADLMLGVLSAGDRSDHRHRLLSGETLLLMTDGLFERRSASYTESLAELMAYLATLPPSTVENFCDGVLAYADTNHTEDDVAIVAVRCFGA